jgi:hypothetical protein
VLSEMNKKDFHGYSIHHHVVNQKTEHREQSKIPEPIVRQGASIITSRFSVSFEEVEKNE